MDDRVGLNGELAYRLLITHDSAAKYQLQLLRLHSQLLPEQIMSFALPWGLHRKKRRENKTRAKSALCSLSDMAGLFVAHHATSKSERELRIKKRCRAGGVPKLFL